MNAFNVFFYPVSAGVPQSPIVPLNERFGSPSSGTAAKRNLFGSPTSAGQSPSSSSTSASVNVTTHLTSAGKATIIGTLVQGKTLLINSGKPAGNV